MRIKLPPAIGALASQVAQAFGAFLLQILAARELGASSFGVFAFLFGAIVMATAVSTGLIGDSLTVLERQDPRVRAALWRLSCVTIALSAAIGLVTALVFGNLDWPASVAFACALAMYMAADLSRRLLMAVMRFWSLVVVNAGGALVSLGYVGILMLRGPLSLADFLVAITLGQLCSYALCFVRLPAAERRRAPAQWGAWREVIDFGIWRSAQQFVRPTMLNAARWIVLIMAGQAAVGALEAARVYVAPAMLLIQGLSSYLFASYAKDKAIGMTALLRRADRAALTMLGGAIVGGGLAAAALPFVGDMVTGGQFELTVVAVLGWSCYAASCAAVLPYGSLAAVRGRQRFVLVLRVVDSLISISIAGITVLLLHVDTDWTPWLISIGSFAGGLLCRQLILRKEARRETQQSIGERHH